MSNDYDVETIVRRKRDIREFKPEPIKEDQLWYILEAGRLAPSSKNAQPWHFIVIRNKETLQELAKTTPTGSYLANAPLAIAVVLENAKLESDAGRAVQNMVLVAWKYNIGSVWITNFDSQARKILKIPATEKFKLVTVVPFGYIPEVSRPQGK